MQTFKWQGTIALLDTPTHDGRTIPSKQFTWRQLPLPLRALPNRKTRDAHMGARLVGSITAIHIVGNQIRAAGQIETRSPEGLLLSAGEKLTGGADLIPADNWTLTAFTIHNSPTWPEIHIQKV